MLIKCIYCNKEFHVPQYRSKTAKFCSIACSSKWKWKNKVFSNYRNQKSGSKHGMWKGGNKINSQGYILIYMPNHPFCDKQKYVRQHRLVLEKKLGHFLQPNEVVHHINGDKQDNRLENLELSLNSDHSRHHQIERMKKYKKLRIQKSCEFCSKKFSVPKSQDRIKCCSISCSRKLQWRKGGLCFFGR